MNYKQAVATGFMMAILNETDAITAERLRYAATRFGMLRTQGVSMFHSVRLSVQGGDASSTYLKANVTSRDLTNLRAKECPCVSCTTQRLRSKPRLDT